MCSALICRHRCRLYHDPNLVRVSVTFRDSRFTMYYYLSVTWMLIMVDVSWQTIHEYGIRTCESVKYMAFTGRVVARRIAVVIAPRKSSGSKTFFCVICRRGLVNTLRYRTTSITICLAHVSTSYDLNLLSRSDRNWAFAWKLMEWVFCSCRLLKKDM